MPRGLHCHECESCEMETFDCYGLWCGTAFDEPWRKLCGRCAVRENENEERGLVQ